MVWSKELAKLKQDLNTPGENQPAVLSAKPKPSPAPVQPKPLDEEDAFFLAAMGMPRETNLKVGSSHDDSDVFEAAMSQLKGIRHKHTDVPLLLDSEEASGEDAEPQQAYPKENADESIPVAQELPEELPQENSRDGTSSTLPEKIQLAAGMTIEVDGQLDLRNHNAVDARERLKERVLDGFCMGWRSLHVILGNSEPLQEAFIEYIGSPEPGPIAKYAQAPVPMGGTKAWILYYEAQSN
jgi:DNA-nicking Smr family endonuclease